MNLRPLLGVIPARGGSEGLPDKNIRLLAGLPLIAHSILFAKLCPEIERCIVSTDSDRIASVARKYGGDVPFMRPSELARNHTPALPVVQHALRALEEQEGRRYATVVLLQPTSPARIPEDVSRAMALLAADDSAVGVIAASEPYFNPRYVCVEEKDGYMVRAFAGSGSYPTRQQVPKLYRVNGLLYLWTRDHVMSAQDVLADGCRQRMLLVPEERGLDIDELRDLRMAELLIRESVIRLPWLQTKAAKGSDV